MHPILVVARFPRQVYATTIHELKARYAATTLGFLWPLIFPLMFLAAYALVFLYVFKVKPDGLTSGDYLLVVFTGLVPFLGFSESFANGATSLLESRGLIKNTLFPIELVPVKAVLLGKTTMLAGLLFLILYLLATGMATWWILLLPGVVVLHVAFAIGLAWFVSALAVVVRDVAQMVSVIILMLMLLSPIAYLPSMVPPALQFVFGLNPLYYIISAYRFVLLGMPMSMADLAIFLTMCIATPLIGAWVFARLKDVFGDFL